jgi:predicted GNAT family acetyltransferase
MNRGRSTRRWWKADMAGVAHDTADGVIDHAARRRFELDLGADGIAFIDYRYRDGERDAPAAVCVLTHAEVPAAARGGGVGARLTAGALQLLRARGQQVVPACPYVAAFIRRHPDYADLIAAD